MSAGLRYIEEVGSVTATIVAPIPLPVLIASPLVAGRVDENVGAWLGSTAPTVGQKTMAASVPVVLPSDQLVTLAEPVSVDDNGGSLTVDTPQLPAALVGGRLDENLGAWLGSTAPTVGQKTAAASIPVVLASDQPVLSVTTTPQVVGAHGNAWNAAAVGAGGLSAVVDAQYTPFVSIFGSVTGGATTITVQLSQDNVNFYDAETTVANGDFSVQNSYGARYVRLRSSNARTITATIAGKD